DDGWSDVVAGEVEPLAAGGDHAVGARLCDRALEPLDRGGVHDGTGVGVSLAGIADRETRGVLGQPLDELVVHVGGDDRARAGAALLAREAEGRPRDALDRLVEIGSPGDDRRILAAHLDERRSRIRTLLEPPGDRAPDLRRAGEGDAVDVGLRERPAGLAAAVDDVHDALRKT